jgi:hypothetical protein
VKKRRIRSVRQRRIRERRHPQPPPPPRVRQRWWSPLLRPKLLVIEIPGATTAFLGLYALWVQAAPTIVPPNVSENAAALAAPFLIENRSSLFTFSDVTTMCIADEIKWIGPPLFPSIAYPSPQHRVGQIAPGESKPVVCLVPISGHPLSEPPRPMPGPSVESVVDYARVHIEVSYSTLLVPRRFVSGHFCWAPTSPSGHQWSPCDQL